MNEPESGLLAILLFPVVWTGILGLVAHFGGWSRLARQFPAERRPAGKTYRGQSVGLSGFASYGGCTTLIDSPEGLYVSLPFFFGLFHPPLLIPWAELRQAQPKKVLWQRSIVVNVGDPPLRLELPADRFEHRLADLRGTLSARSPSGTVPESKDEGKIFNRR